MKRRLSEWLWGCQPKAAPSPTNSISVNALMGPGGAYILIEQRWGETYYFRNLAYGIWRSKTGKKVLPVLSPSDVITAQDWMPIRDPQTLKAARKLLGLEIECIESDAEFSRHIGRQRRKRLEELEAEENDK